MSDSDHLPFLDTNILVYAFSDDVKKARAAQLLRQPFSLSVQALNEFVHVLKRRMRFDPQRIASSADDVKWAAHTIFPVTVETHSEALVLSSRYNLSFYDALMVACALQAGAAILYSEDMQHHLRIDDRLSIVNPFLS